MENNTQEEEVYTITPKGELCCRLADAIKGMLAEQKTVFIQTLYSAVSLMTEGNIFAAAMALSSTLCMIGFDGFGDTEDRR